ncbi:hypothetical protein [Ferribacterium limneticum]|uniref:hypothetical protein n=1 Tax=Ferribacterium limneticum TaxID=76259 RepID=UPI001CF91438|nr:hypothetical protein [Ferribacterium limneticum]UCV23258.1 hypothetical protein KI613_01555 [Ferribacterium limneticum]
MYNIVDQQTITGSSTESGFICGSRPAVCFQDAPLIGICQNVFYEQKHKENNAGLKTRYRAVGVALPKDYAYCKGARPVIYDKTAEAKQYLPKDQWWRIVNFDLTNKDSFVDWTHEREWRVPGNFNFELEQATLLFVQEKNYRAFISLCKANKKDYMDRIKGVVIMDNLLY